MDHKASSNAYGKAQYIFDYLMKDPDFAKPGRRNDDGVDLCIVCYILGYDPYEMVNTHSRLAGCKVNNDDLIQIHNVIVRVKPYLSDWSRQDIGNMLSYLVAPQRYE